MRSMVSVLLRFKTIKLPFWYHKSVHNSMIARAHTSGSHSSQTSIVFPKDLDFVSNSERPQQQGVCKARIDCTISFIKPLDKELEALYPFCRDKNPYIFTKTPSTLTPQLWDTQSNIFTITLDKRTRNCLLHHSVNML